MTGRRIVPAGMGLLAAATMAMAGAAAAQKAERPTSPRIAESAAKPWTKAPAARPKTLRFAVIGDRTGLARPGLFEQAVRQVDWLQPEFLINVGDLIEGYTGDPAEIAREWAPIERSVEALSIPFVYVAGNHDLGNEAMLSHWRRQRGQPYYHFVFKNVLFLILDTEDPPRDMPPAFAAMFHDMAEKMKSDPAGTEQALHASLAKVNADRAAGTSMAELKALEGARLSDAQVDYALKVLSDNRTVRWTFVLMHKPAWKLQSAAFDRIEAALGTRGYTVIAGHNHYYAHEQRNGRDYITMGTAGAVSHQEGPGKMDHIAWVTVADGAPRIALLRLDGILDPAMQTGQTLLTPKR